MDSFETVMICLCGLVLFAYLITPSPIIYKETHILSKDEIPIYHNICNIASKYGLNVLVKRNLTEIISLSDKESRTETGKKFLGASDRVIDFVIVNSESYPLLLIILEDIDDDNANKQMLDALENAIKKYTKVPYIFIENSPEDMDQVRSAIKKCR